MRDIIITAGKAIAVFLIFQGTVATAIKVDRLAGCHDHNVTLNCAPFKTSEPAELKWTYRDTKANTWEDIAAIEGQDPKLLVPVDSHYKHRVTIHKNGSLEIASLKPEDETLYRCLVIKRTGRTKSYLVELNVTCNGKATFTKQEVCVEEDVLLDCKAKHRTNPRKLKHVTWHKKNGSRGSWFRIVDSDNATVKVGERFKLHDNGSLLLKGGRHGDGSEGIYKCDVTKTVRGSLERHLVVVKNIKCRREKRDTDRTPGAISVCVGQHVQLPCPIVETTNMSVIRSLKWRAHRTASPKHYQQLVHARPVKTGNETILVPGHSPATRLHDAAPDRVGLAPNGSLIIKGVRVVDEGDFECIVKVRHHGDAQIHRVQIKPKACNTTEVRPTGTQLNATAVPPNATTTRARVAMTIESSPRGRNFSMAAGKLARREETINLKNNTRIAHENTSRKIGNFTEENQETSSNPAKLVSASSPSVMSPTVQSIKASTARPVDGQNHTAQSNVSTRLTNPLAMNYTQRKRSVHQIRPLTNNAMTTKISTSTSTWSVVKPAIQTIQTTTRVTTVTTSTTTFSTAASQGGEAKQKNVTVKTNGQYKSEVPSKKDSTVCGISLENSFGEFQSPNFPQNYPDNADCKWTISVPQDYAAIDIELHGVDLEDEENCRHDYLALYDGLGNQVGCRHCGVYSSPRKYTVKGRVAVVVFHTDSTVHKTGFKLTYRAALPAGKSAL